jgi:ubiquinone/menaquinone biosynthesis C-methylase UbiE
MCVNEGWLYSQYLSSLKPGDEVLDIGCAYGDTVLKAGQKKVLIWANDIESKHLDVLKEKADQADFKNNITYRSGDFLTTDFPEGKFDKILIASVLHFMTPKEIETTLTKIRALLKPGGKVYILTASPAPYLKMSAAFKDLYTKKKEAGDLWPGYITNAKELLPQIKDSTPDTCTFCELETLKNTVAQSGLKIITARYEASSYGPARVNLGAQDFVNIIAEKK